MSQGFRQPWQKGGGYSLSGKRKVVRGIPEWWADLPPGCPNYDRLAQTYSTLLLNQATLIRRKQMAQKALEDGAAVPAWAEITSDEMDFLLKATGELSKARTLMLRERVEMGRVMKAVKANPFQDPRGDAVPEDEGEFGVDGRGPA